MIKRLKYILLVFPLLLLPFRSVAGEAAGSVSAEAVQGSQVDIKSMLFGHIGDSYQWHITRIGDKELTIPLPVIVCSKDSGWHCFLSSRLEDGPYEGFYIAEGGKYDGKIVEKDAAGAEVRPFDISITKNVLGLMINSAILVVLILCCSRWYRRHDALKDTFTLQYFKRPLKSFT